MNIGIALLKARKDKGFRQTEVAKRTKLSQTYLSQIENGSKIPSIEVIEKLSKEYGIPFPIMMWFSLTENDIKKDKLLVYRAIKPTMDNMIDSLFKY